MAARPTPQWFRDIVSGGVSNLLDRHLPSSPIKRHKAHCISAWTRVLWLDRGVEWDKERHQVPLERAFRGLLWNAEKWPKTADVWAFWKPRRSFPAPPRPALTEQEKRNVEASRASFWARLSTIDN